MEKKWGEVYNQLAQQHGATARASDYFNEASFYHHQKKTLEWLGPLAGKRVLDVGCGTGLFIKPLTESNKVDGVDLAPEALKLAELQGLQCYLGSILDVDLPEETYDLVTCIGAIQYMDKLEDSIEKLKNMVAPGGALVIETVSKRSSMRWILEKINSEPKYSRRICPNWLDKQISGKDDFKLVQRLNFYLPTKITSSVLKPGLIHESLIGTYVMKWQKAGNKGQ